MNASDFIPLGVYKAWQVVSVILYNNTIVYCVCLVEQQKPEMFCSFFSHMQCQCFQNLVPPKSLS